jgi:hypothetical protein
MEMETDKHFLLFGRARWLLIFTAVANITYDLAVVWLHPSGLAVTRLFVRGMLCGLVCFGIGWARVMLGIVSSLAIIGAPITLLTLYLNSAKYSRPVPSDIVLLCSAGLAVGLWTLFAVAFSRTVSTFFLDVKYRK